MKLSFAGAHTPARTRLLDLAFVVALAIGAFLRLFQLGSTQFWKDSAGTYALSHDMLTLGGFPVTGIPFSIGTFSPPTSVYIYMLPSLLGSPTLGSIETALATVAAIALTYYVCRLYLNPVIGLITTLIFSISAGSITFSRFIWPPNFITPVAVLLLAVMLAGVVGKLRGWLAWALPFLGILIQMHPVTAGLIVLLVIGWILAPETVRIRDVILGGAAAVAVYLPLIVFEISTGFVDLRTYRHVATTKPVVSATVFHRFLDINSLIQPPGWSGSPLYYILNAAWEALLVSGLLYLALRIVVPAIRAARRSLGRAGWRERMTGALGWMRSDAQTRWRTELVVLLWPALILLVQIRHTTPIEIHYLIATFPTQFLALAILLYDLGATVPSLRAARRIAAAGSVAIASVLVAVICLTQIVGIPMTYLGPQPRSLQAQESGLARAQHLAAQYHVAMVIFQLDYQTVEATEYMLQTNYQFPMPTQIMSSGNCLVGGPSASARILYLMSGKVSRWESVLAQIPDVHDLMGHMPAGDYYRAYVVSSGQITDHLQPFGKIALSTPIVFDNTIAVDHIWQAPLSGQSTSSLALETHLERKSSAPPFHQMYGLSVTMTKAASQQVTAESRYCNVAPWIPQQTIYYMFSQITSAGIGLSDSLTLSAGSGIFGGPVPRAGPLRLISAYDLTSVEYMNVPTTSQTFAVTDCGQVITCVDGNTAMVRAG